MCLVMFLVYEGKITQAGACALPQQHVGTKHELSAASSAVQGHATIAALASQQYNAETAAVQMQQ